MYATESTGPSAGLIVLLILLGLLVQAGITYLVVRAAISHDRKLQAAMRRLAEEEGKS